MPIRGGDTPFTPQQQPPQQQPPQQLPPQMGNSTFSPSASDIASMTHQPEQPNPAMPYLQAAQRFVSGPPEQRGLSGLLSGQLPQWANQNPLANLWRNPNFETAASFGTGALRLSRLHYNRPVWGAQHSFDLINDAGDAVGNIHLNYDPPTGHLKVEWLGSNEGYGAGRRWTLGSNPVESAAEMRSLIGPLSREFPGVKTVEFMKVGGVNETRGTYTTRLYEIKHGPDGPYPERISNRVYPSGRVPLNTRLVSPQSVYGYRAPAAGPPSPPPPPPPMPPMPPALPPPLPSVPSPPPPPVNPTMEQIRQMSPNELLQFIFRRR